MMPNFWQRIAKVDGSRRLVLMRKPTYPCHMNPAEKQSIQRKTPLTWGMLRRKLFLDPLLGEFFFLVALTACVMVSGEILIARIRAGLLNEFLSVFLTVLALSLFGFLIVRARSSRRKAIFELLKSRHSRFFDSVRCDVTKLMTSH